MSIDRELRAPQLTPRGEGRRVPKTGGQATGSNKAAVSGPSGNPKLLDPLGHELRDQRITKNGELLGWAETVQQPASGDTIAPEAGNVALVSGGSYSLGTPPAIPTYQNSTRQRAWMVVVVDQASSATFSNVSFGDTLNDANGDPIPLSGTTTYIMLYVEPIGSWFGFLAGTGH